MEWRDDLVSTLRVACVLDPAIDREQTDVVTYAETRDPALIVPMPGQAVRWFHVRPLTQSHVASIDSQPEGSLRWTLAFSLSVEAIDSLLVPGQRWAPTTSIRNTATGKQIKCCSDRELEIVHAAVGKSWIYEIGKLAYDRADEGNVLGGSASYTLPPTSVAGLDRIARQLAAAIQTSSPTEPSDLPAPSGATPPEPT